MNLNLIPILGDPGAVNSSFSVTWSAALQIAWNKKSFTCEKSSILTGFFFYTNMTAESLFCT